jgi:hypothetical protein
MIHRFATVRTHEPEFVVARKQEAAAEEAVAFS